jgi:hypothetical protein
VTPSDDRRSLTDGRRGDLVALACIVAAAAIFFAPFLFGGKFFLAGDTLYNFFPWRSYAAPGFRAHNSLITDPINHNYAEIFNRKLKEGGLEDWSPYFYNGVPATSIAAQQGISGRTYPLKLLLHRLFSTPVAHDLTLFLHVLLMGLTMYLFLREVGAGMEGALFGSVAYMFNGCAMVWLEFETVVAAYAFFPLALFCMERFRSPRRWFWAFAAAAVAGVMALMGHIQYYIYTWLLLGAYFLLLLLRSPEGGGRRPFLPLLGCFAVMGVGAGLVAALDLVPIAELVGQSSRIGRQFTFRSFFDTMGEVHLRYWVTLLFPDYFGSPPLRFNVIPMLPTQEYMNYCELTLYAGIPTLFAFLGLAASPRTAHGRFFLVSTVLVALMLGGTVAYYPFFALVPGMDKMNPTRLIFLFNLVFAAGAGLGIANLRTLTARGRWVFLGLALALQGLTLFLAFGSASPGLIAWFNAEHLRGMFAGVAGALANLRALSSPVIQRPLLLSLAAAALFTGLAFAGRRRRVWGLLISLAVVLLAWDLITFGRSYNTVVPREYLYARTPGIEFLQRQPKPFRVVQHGGAGFGVNTLGPFGIEEVGGYSSFYPRAMNRLASYIEYGDLSFRGRLMDRWVTFGNLESPLFDLMDARFFLVPPGYPLNRPGAVPVYRGEMDIYRNDAALPRAWVVHSFAAGVEENQAIAMLATRQLDPARVVLLDSPPSPSFRSRADIPPGSSRVAVERYTDSAMLLAADLEAEGILVVANSFYPGWEARVDGRPAPILRANLNFQAVLVPQGRHTVEFRYRPSSFRRGRWAAGAGVIFIAGGLLLFGPAGRRYRQRSGETAAEPAPPPEEES